jgi:hypothetical protein
MTSKITMSRGSAENAGCVNYKNELLQAKSSAAIEETVRSAGDKYNQREMFRKRHFTTCCIFGHRLQFFETIF